MTALEALPKLIKILNEIDSGVDEVTQVDEVEALLFAAIRSYAEDSGADPQNIFDNLCKANADFEEEHGEKKGATDKRWQS